MPSSSASATDGPLSTADFKEHAHSIDWWWAPTRAARAVLEALFVTGRVGIARRQGSRRFYDLIERLVPGRPARAARAAEVGQTGIGCCRGFERSGSWRRPGRRSCSTPPAKPRDRARRIAELLDDGTLLPARWRANGRRVTCSPLSCHPGKAEREPTPPAVTFLAPLDPLVWDRRLMRTLFEFDYIWEIYTPAAKRRHGYYALPILYRDRLIGRIEPRREKANPDLQVLGIWFEDGGRTDGGAGLHAGAG